MKVFRPPTPTLDATTDTLVIHYPPRDEVRSRFKLIATVAASSQDDAEDKSRAIVDQLLTALSLTVGGRRYACELRRIRRRDDPHEYSGFSQTATIAPLAEPLPISIEEMQAADRLSQCIDNDEAAGIAYSHLLATWKLSEISGSKPLKRSIIQHYALSVEAVVNATMSRVRVAEADAIRFKEREFAASFARELQGRADQPKAVREASTRLREIGLQNTLPAIDRVALVLGIEDESRDRAKDLYRLRSRSLSHPGRTDDATLNEWLRPPDHTGSPCRADQIARNFVRNYCRTLPSPNRPRPR